MRKYSTTLCRDCPSFGVLQGEKGGGRKVKKGEGRRVKKGEGKK
jgi:hypothetical protein